MKLQRRPLEERYPESAAEIAALRLRAEAAESDLARTTELWRQALKDLALERSRAEAAEAERDAARRAEEDAHSVADSRVRDAAEYQRAAEAAEAERDRLRETVARLNRRCQEAEAAVAEKVQAHPHASLGRALANAAASSAEAERDRLREALDRLQEAHRKCRWNIREDHGDLYVCRGEHDKALGCEEQRFILAPDTAKEGT